MRFSRQLHRGKPNNVVVK